MLHKANFLLFLDWLLEQPKSQTLPTHKTQCPVSVLFQSYIQAQIPENAEVSLGYSSVLVKNGDTFELGETQKERDDAFDLVYLCNLKTPRTFGELSNLVLLFKNKNSESRVAIANLCERK